MNSEQNPEIQLYRMGVHISIKYLPRIEINILSISQLRIYLFSDPSPSRMWQHRGMLVNARNSHTRGPGVRSFLGAANLRQGVEVFCPQLFLFSQQLMDTWLPLVIKTILFIDYFYTLKSIMVNHYLRGPSSDHLFKMAD